MAETPDELRYAKSHEWARVADGIATVGITDHAQDALTDIVFVELPEVGKSLKQGEGFGVVESIKSVSDLYAPVSGKVVEVNEALGDKPELVNDSPYGDGWMIRIELADKSELERLLDAAGYKDSIEGS